MQIIAEIGANFNSLEQAFEMIEMSKETGCDYAKFQLYDSETIKDHPLRYELAKRMLSREDAQALFDYGKDVARQKVFFTPMFLDAIDYIADMGCELIKIRYADRGNIGLVNRSLDVGVPVLLSADRHYIKYWQNPQIKLLYCISRYPARQEEYVISTEDFTTGAYHGAPVFAGVSDHTKGFDVLDRSLRFGAAFCEVHVMLEDTEPLEAAWSKTFEELGEWIANQSC